MSNLKNITDRGSTYGELKQVSKLSYLKNISLLQNIFFFQAPIEAEPTSVPNPHGILTTRPGPNGKSGLHSQWLPFLVSPGAQNGQTTLLERGDTMASNRGRQSAKDSFN